MAVHTALIAFGANLGDGIKTFETVKQRLSTTFGRFGTLRVAKLIRTQPVTLEEVIEPEYWNSAFFVSLSEDWTPQRFLDWLLALEAELGRSRTLGSGEKTHWKARVVDLDILLWDTLFLDATPKLILPHPLLPWRRFVLAPACEIAPEWKHPLLEMTLAQLLARLDEGETLPALVWDSNEPIPSELFVKSRKLHIPILARRWVCRNGESAETFQKICARFVKKS